MGGGGGMAGGKAGWLAFSGYGVKKRVISSQR